MKLWQQNVVEGRYVMSYQLSSTQWRQVESFLPGRPGWVGVTALEDPLPDSGPGPAGETLVDAFPVAVPRGQVFPLGAAAQHPQDAVDEGSVILGGNANPTGTPRQETLHLPPLSAAQLVTHHIPPFHHTLLPEFHCTFWYSVSALLPQPGFAQLSISPS